jgi:hypothetical protein
LFEHGLSGRLWPIHGNPYHDELLSSWLSRLSRAYGANPIQFCTQALSAPIVWQRDIDTGIDNALLLELGAKTATARQRVLGTTVRGYRGYVAADRIALKHFPWLLPMGLRGTTRSRPWLQYCPQCLQGDADPYFRRSWRLAFVTICPEHKHRLLDRCTNCHAPVNFHWLPGDAETMTWCYHCGHDLRWTHALPIDEGREYRRLSQFQASLLRTMRRGKGQLWGLNVTQGASFLQGVYKLMQFFLTKMHAPVFQEAFNEYMHPSFFASDLTATRHRSFEGLDADNRLVFMLFISWWYNWQVERFSMADTETEWGEFISI